jgi:hypothetical protein
MFVCAREIETEREIGGTHGLERCEGSCGFYSEVLCEFGVTSLISFIRSFPLG